MLLPNNQSINWRIFFATRRYLLATVGAGLVVALLIIFVMIPQVNEILSLRAQLQTERPKLERLEQKLADLDSIQFSPEFVQSNLVNEALPSHKPLLELLTSLNTVALSTGVTVRDFQLSPGMIATEGAQPAPGARRTGAVDSLDLSMRLTGEFAKVQEFLLLVEKVTPFTTITKLTVGLQGISQVTDPDDLSALLINADITTKTYFFTQSITATVEGPLPQLTPVDREVLEELSAFDLTLLPEQREITGGLQDLFGVEFELLQKSLQEGLGNQEDLI
jgi:Tfp pilus assembly protein PilO